MGNTFNKTYGKRRSTFNFDLTKDFDMDAFKNVIELFSSNMPSKQHQFPYQIDILDWSDKKLRKDIFYGTMPSEKHKGKKIQELHSQLCSYNNQILAPVLISFTHCLDPKPYIATLEIGMAVMALTYLLQSNGFLTSFCQCIEDANHLGEIITSKAKTTVQVFLCVGQHAYPKNIRYMPNPFGGPIFAKHVPLHLDTPNIKYQIDTSK
tara:strand:- start:3479 stop:4102 length:624 start_codon:yes stop_codon:yes gene_type:complete